MVKTSILSGAVVLLSAAALPSSDAHAQTRSGRAAFSFIVPLLTTCARYEPVGSVLRVTNPQSGKTITAKVTGRGPYNGNRILDLSTGSFSALYGGLGRGHGPVRYTDVKRARR